MLNPQVLLDTHIAIRYMSDPKKLSREQRRAMEHVLRSGGCMGISAFSLLEIALLCERKRVGAGLDELLHELDTNPELLILPLSTDVAREVAALGDALRDPPTG